MPKDTTSFLSVTGKRRILIVDDEAINREILASMLEDEYDLLFAEDGEQAMEHIWANRDTISLVLLDLLMPNMPGQEVLRRMKASPEVRDIPVIVVTADFSQEIVCLDAGASDFIQKPYPNPGVVRARIRRTIELSEDRQIIQSTERDPLTGLYNLEFFYSYAEQFDQHHKDVPTDAIVIDINHFAMINERFGRTYADELLCKVGQRIHTLVHDDGGIVSRSGADIFMAYCPHRDDYKSMMDSIATSLVDTQNANRPIRLRMGVYSGVDKSLNIERRFDRAKMAADTVRGSYTRSIGVYDDALLKSELYAQRLMDEFPHAIEQRQFEVYYQPKFDIQAEKPKLSAAEALIRWKHPELGMINPGVFIPLFEDNGLIQRLDHYVWEEAARQIREWKDTLGWSVPVSVNVSRVDMYDTGIVDTLQTILQTYELQPADLHLEVTESAYAEDSNQIIQMVMRLRALGFCIEMDDFGTGYSSLNMLATLPIDVLKLDMYFVRTAFAQEGDNDTHMLKVVIDIAFHLSVPVIAEGVETEEQLNALKDLGCDTVQGYYFSAPVPASEFEAFLQDDKAAEEALAKNPAKEFGANARLKQAGEDGQRAAWWEHLPTVWLSKARTCFMILALVVAVALIACETMLARGYARNVEASDRNIDARQAASDLEMASDWLTENVRSFVVTGDISYMDNYFEELEVTKRRDAAVQTLEELREDDGETDDALNSLHTALAYSNELVSYEYQAMNLVLATGDYDEAHIPRQLSELPLSEEDEELSDEEKLQKAEELVFGPEYAQYKVQIKASTNECTQSLLKRSGRLHTEAEDNVRMLIRMQVVLTVLLLAVVVAIVVCLYGTVEKPLERMVDYMRKKQVVPPAGAKELRFVAETYNAVFEDNRRKFERLNYGSMHDALTGLFNRKAYDIMRRDMDMSDTALLLVDVDKFKGINDTYGHDVGDLVLKRVAEVLGYTFRSTDLVFRLGGDEFVIIMSNINSSAREQVRLKIEQANHMLQTPTADLPATSLSVGVAFADRQNPEGDIFKDADTALYRMKQSGRCGCIIY